MRALIVFLAVLLGPGIALGQVFPNVEESEAIFAAVDETTTIGASYATAVDLPHNTKVVVLDNQTNGDVWVSLDCGGTDQFHLQAQDVLVLNLARSGLVTTAEVCLKDGTNPSSSGTFYITSYK